MTVIYWIDSAAAFISTSLAAALVLIVFGTGPKRSLNHWFALFALAEAVWAAMHLLVGMSLHMGMGYPEAWQEIGAVSFTMMPAFLLLFTTRFLGRRTVFSDMLGLSELALVLLFAFVLFRGQLITGLRLSGNGIAVFELTLWGYIGAVITAIFYLYVLVLLWVERKRHEEAHGLALSVLILLTGLGIRSLAPQIPVTSVTAAVSVAIIGCAVVRRQLFNPMRDLVDVERTRSRQQDALIRLSAQLAATLDETVACRKFVEGLHDKALGYELISLYLLDERGDRVLRANIGGIIPTEVRRLVPGRGLSERPLLDGKLHYTPDVTREPRYVQVLETGSEVDIPIMDGEKAIGVLVVESHRTNAFGPQDFETLSAAARLAGFAIGRARLFAAEAALAIENAQLYADAQRQRQFFEAMYAHSPVAIVTGVVDEHGQMLVTSCNAAFEKLFGYNEVEIIGFNLDDLITTDSTRAEAVYYSEISTQGEPVRAFTHRKRKDGKLLDIELFGVALKNLGGKPVLLGMYHDITDLRRAEEKLREAKDAAEAANRAKSTFLANMSHELRTPLNVIIGYSEMIEEVANELNAPDIIPDLQRITASGRHLLMLINDILDLSKIEAGRMQLYVEPFDLATLIRDLTDSIQPLVEKNGNTFKLRCPDQLGEMISDPLKVRQCLYNLLSNAGKFTENGAIVLEIFRQPQDGDDWIIFRVSDTGIGMTAEQISRLFQPFVQGDPSATRKFAGTGLGLAITHHYCRMMGGDIEAESELGKGSHFTIRLPAALTPSRLAEPEMSILTEGPSEV